MAKIPNFATLHYSKLSYWLNRWQYKGFSSWHYDRSFPYKWVCRHHREHDMTETQVRKELAKLAKEKNLLSSETQAT